MGEEKHFHKPGEGYKAAEKLGEWIRGKPATPLGRALQTTFRVIKSLRQGESQAKIKWKKRQQQRAAVESQLRELRRTGNY